MPKLKTGFNASLIKHHFDYMGWAYFILPLVMILSWSLIYTFTAPRVPEELKLSLFIVGSYIDSEKMEALAEEVKPDFPDMEELDFLSVELTDINDYYNWQRFTTYLYAQEGDVYILDKALFETLVGQGTFVPLEGLLQPPEDSDLTGLWVQAEDDTEPHLYAIPAEPLYGLMENELFDCRNAVIVVTAFSGNVDSSVRLIEWMIENRSAPPPEYLDRMQPKEPFIPEGYFETMGF